MNINSKNDITIQTEFANINLNASNMNSYGYALPISFSQSERGKFSYTLGGQVFEDVFSSSPYIISLPTNFFAANPQSGYTSSRWKFNFDMNCFNFSNSDDRGFAMYFSFIDSNGNTYEPFLYNQKTPFCKRDSRSTFSGAYTDFKSVNFSDYIDFFSSLSPTLLRE